MPHIKFAIIATAFTLTACTTAPVADLRASGDKAHLYQRDLVECRGLVREAYPWALTGVNQALWRCLEGRGHSIVRID